MKASRRLAGTACVAALAFACTAAASPGGEVGAESFHHGLSGWNGQGATVRIVRGGPDGQDTPRPVRRAKRGALYDGSAWVRHKRGGGTLCIRIREVKGGRIVGSGQDCERVNGRWQKLGVSYTARANGSKLGVGVLELRARGGSAFRADRISLVRRPHKVKPPPPTRGAAFGTQFHCTWAVWSNADRLGTLDKLQDAGVRWVRIDVAWDGIEHTRKGARNAWYIGMVDFCVNEARKRGLKVLVTLWLTPSWANGGASNKVPPTNAQDYGDFARWAAAYWRGRVAAWEIWNEPDQRRFWDGTMEQYVGLARAAYPGFKTGAPKSLVVLAGPSSNDDGLVRRWYELGVKGSFDVLATHPYQGIADAPPEHPDDGNRWWLSHAPAVKAVMNAYGDGHKPIWFTEMGWSAHSNWAGIANWQRGVTLEQQADYLVRSIDYIRSSFRFVDVMFWYKERAAPGSTDVVQNGYALLDANLAERPAYAALKRRLAQRS